MSCRQNGLEVKRRCGFLPDEKRGEARIVWGRKQTQSDECPKSLVTPESVERVERFFARKHFGVRRPGQVWARDADAFLALEQEWQREQLNGQQ